MRVYAGHRNRAYGYWKENTKHPSLNFERVDDIDDIWLARIGLGHRALCKKRPGPRYVWFWIGTHAEYDLLIN